MTLINILKNPRRDCGYFSFPFKMKNGGHLSILKITADMWTRPLLKGRAKEDEVAQACDEGCAGIVGFFLRGQRILEYLV